jgi:2-hydroxychromene-2-carboxylate isomerase
MKQVEFLYDYGSPFSYLADRRLPAVGRAAGAAIIYTPVSLGAVLKATGNSSPMAIPAKGRYMGIELRRWAGRYGCPAPANPHFPINTMKLMRGAVASRHLGVFDRYHATIFDAFWVKGLNFGDEAVFAGVLESTGLPAKRILAEIETPAIKDELRANTDGAVARGMFGAPTFFVGDEMFWGNDRLDWVEEALNRQR